MYHVRSEEDPANPVGAGRVAEAGMAVDDHEGLSRHCRPWDQVGSNARNPLG